MGISAALLLGGCGTSTKYVSCTKLAHETIFSELRSELLKEAQKLGPRCKVKVPK
jgi:hypothetical protein